MSEQQSWPVPYEAPYKTGWEAFVAAAIAHYNASPNLSQISYMRVGRSAAEKRFRSAFRILSRFRRRIRTACRAGCSTTPTSINLVQAQSPKMQILDPLNQAGSGGSANANYGSSEAQIAAGYKNAPGATNGIGSQGMQASDITNYNAGSSCSSDWCAEFDNYYQSGVPLELQQAGLVGASGDRGDKQRDGRSAGRCCRLRSIGT